MKEKMGKEFALIKPNGVWDFALGIRCNGAGKANGALATPLTLPKSAATSRPWRSRDEVPRTRPCLCVAGICAITTSLPPIGWVVDLTTALLIFGVLGWQLLLLPGLALEAIPGLGILHSGCWWLERLLSSALRGRGLNDTRTSAAAYYGSLTVPPTMLLGFTDGRRTPDHLVGHRDDRTDIL